MARKKVKIAYITKNSERKTTLKKRKSGLIKKMTELSTLCGIEACAIIYNPGDSQPEVWPSPSEVEQLLEIYMVMPDIEKSRNTVDRRSLLEEMISKAKGRLRKAKKETREKELTLIMFDNLIRETPQLQDLNLMDMNDLRQVVNHRLEEIINQKKILSEEASQNQNQAIQFSPELTTMAADPDPMQED